jgi:hypothetical protein
MPLPKSCCSTLFTAVYKRPLKEEEGLFAFGFYMRLLPLAFALDFLVWEAFGRKKNY